MINVTALTKGDSLVEVEEGLSNLNRDEVKWFWADFDDPNDEETAMLNDYFGFHHLAIEDCLHWLQRPKVDFYDGYNFFVLHTIDPVSLSPVEINLFIGEGYLVSFHRDPLLHEFEQVRKDLYSSEVELWEEGNVYVAYLLMDKIVDMYFPAIYKLEDDLKEFDDVDKGALNKSGIERLFDIRADILKLMRTVNAMKELVYRVLTSPHLKHFLINEMYFKDVFDHLLRLSETLEANREITSDIRDSFLSINSNRMNRVMTLLTIITTIFIPITFIAGIYGMNFKHMPELTHPYGYFIVLSVMALIGILMFLWFKKKGWFDLYK
ncbi:MAG TPA: magnesium and cobalt transport protein CorA [Eubacteriaceae bacterium]|nr:magnesium and cobalt transport protein CorA [Eubacteriaceae bacterium]